MRKLEIFRYALFPAGASYSDADLKKRVADSKCEIKVLLGDTAKAIDYCIVYEYFNDQSHLWLVVVAVQTIQHSFEFFSKGETIVEFVLRIQERVSSLPVILNSIVLEIDACRFSANSIISENKQLVSLVLKRSGKHQKIELNGKVQEVLFPKCNPFKLESKPRLIRFKINSLSKYEAVIYEIEDPCSVIPRGSKMSLIFGVDIFNRRVFKRLADDVFFENEVKLMVNVKVDILESRPVEYHFNSEVTIKKPLQRLKQT